MIYLVDQSDPEKLKFHCDRCDRSFVQSTRAFLDLHVPDASQDAAKLGIPPCQPLPVAVPVAPAAPPRRRAPKAKAAPAAPKGRKPKAAKA